MENNKHINRDVTIEPHEPLLSRPPEDQFLYKVMRVEDLIMSISDSYLHFNRVDSYKDFDGADAQDGEQLPQDLNINQNTKFIKAPDFSAADYYSQFRVRTYACCFSIENSDYIWLNYGNGGNKGKVCLVIRFGKLRAMLNDAILKGTWLLDNGIRLRPIFDINYGLIDYIDWKDHRSNVELFQNPIKYIYFKDKKRFQNEKELRVSLSTEGLRKITLNDGSVMKFPMHLQMAFHFGTAIENGTIDEILHSPDCDSEYLYSELQKFGIERKNIKGS